MVPIPYPTQIVVPQPTPQPTQYQSLYKRNEDYELHTKVTNLEQAHGRLEQSNTRLEQQMGKMNSLLKNFKGDFPLNPNKTLSLQIILKKHMSRYMPSRPLGVETKLIKSLL